MILLRIGKSVLLIPSCNEKRVQSSNFSLLLCVVKTSLSSDSQPLFSLPLGIIRILHSAII